MGHTDNYITPTTSDDTGPDANRYIYLDFDLNDLKLTIQLKMDDEGIVLDVYESDEPIATTSQTYADFGFEVTRLPSEEADEPDDDPRCVCGVYRSEHSMMGCPEGFQTPASWEKERQAIRQRAWTHDDDRYDEEDWN